MDHRPRRPRSDRTDDGGQRYVPLPRARPRLLCPQPSRPPMTVTDRPDILWRPRPHDIEGANVTHFMSWLDRRRGIAHKTWNDLWEWSVHDLDAFWSAVWDYYGVVATRRPDQII